MYKALIIATTIFVLGSCKKNNNTNAPVAYTPECSGVVPSFSATVNSLIISSCSSSNCHATGCTSGPGALINYSQISNSASSIRASIVNGSMPKGSTLTTAQKNTIVCWIDGGAKNN